MQNAQSPSKSRYQLSRPFATDIDGYKADFKKTGLMTSMGDSKMTSNDFNHKNTPLRRSSSVSAIIYGEQSPNHHYIDSLQRFRRDHDACNKQDRQRQKQILQGKIQHKRNAHYERENNVRQKQDNYLRRMVQKNTKILQDHKLGLIRSNNFQNSIPVNIINQKYEDNIHGQNQKQLDDQVKVKKLIRLHHLETKGCSGFNVVNNTTMDHTNYMLGLNKDIESKFGQKLEKFYSKFTIKPLTQEESAAAWKRNHAY